MRAITHIFIHHNGYFGRTVHTIRRAHKAQGWKDIGYHFVIHEDGSLHEGRPVEQPGAHVAGMNRNSLGVCLIGNGNVLDFNAKQYATLKTLLLDLAAKHPEAQILGHRESGRTSKSCPGHKVNMDRIRDMVRHGQQAPATDPGHSPGDPGQPD